MSKRSLSRALSRAGCSVAVILVALVLSGLGCGSLEPAVEPVDAERVSPSSVPTIEPTTSLERRAESTVVDRLTGASEDDPFSVVAARMTPTVVYEPTYLPEGSTFPSEWWPVLELPRPEDYTGASVSNPLIEIDEGRAIGAQIVVATADGWLLFVEDFRGDLGETVGREVGEVEGQRALLYEMGEVVLVQWSDEGRWYGVVGRDLPSAEVIEVALRMRKASVSAGE